MDNRHGISHGFGPHSEQSDGFMIGGSRTPGPLVSHREVCAHLAVLHAFGELREQVHAKCRSQSVAASAATVPVPPAPEDSGEQGWTQYLTKASYRFEVYFGTIVTEQSMGQQPARVNLDAIRPGRSQLARDEAVDVPDHLLPPIDVAMLWHAYLLNPLRAYEDALRLPSRTWLLALRFPLEKLAHCLNTPGRSDTARRYWEERVDQPYELQMDATIPRPGWRPTSADGLMISCPRCSRQTYVPFRRRQGGQPGTHADLGLADKDWERICRECGQRVNKDTLQGRRLIDDLTSWSTSENYRLPGELIDPVTGQAFTDSPADVYFCGFLEHSNRRETARLIGRGAPLGNIPVQHLGATERFSVSAIAKQSERLILERQPKHLKSDERFKSRLSRRTRLLFGPYIDSGVLGDSSIDLVLATKRQQSFVAEMAKLRWSDLERLRAGADDVSLARGVIRYHQWLHLMAERPRLLCPTLDIDLVWHTHQISSHYVTDVITYVKRFVDHSDRIEEGVLSEAFKQTAELWKTRFGQPYSQCGCIHNAPGVTEAIERVLNGEGRLRDRLKASLGRPGDPKASFDDATHPSAHQSFILLDSGVAARRALLRYQKYTKKVHDKLHRPNHDDPFLATYHLGDKKQKKSRDSDFVSEPTSGSCVSASCCNSYGTSSSSAACGSSACGSSSAGHSSHHHGGSAMCGGGHHSGSNCGGGDSSAGGGDSGGGGGDSGGAGCGGGGD